jgi:hypothetical protein
MGRCVRDSNQGCFSMKLVSRSTRIRLIAMMIVVAIVATAAPAMAAVIYDTPADGIAAKFASLLDPKPAPFVKIVKVYAPLPVSEAPMVAAAAPATQEAPAIQVASLTEASVMVQAPLPVAQAPVKPQATSSGTAATRPAAEATGDETAQARAILAGLIAQHPTLQGVTVSMGETPGGYQAVAYYESGRILVNPNHTASLSRILNHEVWHIIDWRDNGVIDWGENVPPA